MVNSPFTVFDTEDNSLELEYKANEPNYNKVGLQYAAIAFDGEKFFTKSKEKFLHWLEHSNDKIFYAHNLQYDLGNLFCDNLDELDIVMVGSRLIRANWRGKEFRDSWNLYAMPLKKIGEKFGLKKLDMDLKGTKYVYRDCEIVRKAVMFIYEFCVKNKMTKLSASLGGLCMKTFVSMNLKNCQLSDVKVRDCLYGGRVELFSQGGKGNIFYTDVNSIYPWSMTLEFPDNKLKKVKDLNKRFGYALVKVEVPEMAVAPLPWRLPYKTDEYGKGSVFYPVGTFTGCYTFYELENAIKHGVKIIKIIEAYGTDQGHKYYAPFIFRFYKARLKAKTECEKLLYKLLMNNLYGQLAMSGKIVRSQVMSEAFLKNEIRRKDGSIRGVFGNKILIEKQFKLPEHVNILHGAYVTAYARVRLFDYLRQIEPKNLIYCDTDSMIFFNQDDKLPFKISSELGEMKLEAKSNYCEVSAPKCYRFGDKFVVKGVNRDKAKNFFESGMATVMQPFKLREAINFFDRGNTKKLSVWRAVTKKKITYYRKKTLKNGLYYPIILKNNKIITQTSK